MDKISCVIITLNEERNIGRCLESVKNVVDEIVVVDSFSKDSTESICKKYGVNFFQSQWAGYSDTKNLGSRLAKNNWILSMDADEALSVELQQSIMWLKSQPKIVNAKFNRLTNYCGKWVHHSGWYPDTKFRLFDKRVSHWEGSIHEELVTSDPVIIKLAGDCFHFSYYTVAEHYRQVDHYSTLGAEALFRQRKEINFFLICMKVLFKFFRNYILKTGFLDGSAGFTIAKISAYETYLKYYKLKQLYKQNKN